MKQEFINELKELMFKHNVYLDTGTDGWIDVCFHEQPYKTIDIHYDTGYSQFRVEAVVTIDNETII
jgi:hypothetical protein